MERPAAKIRREDFERIICETGERDYALPFTVTTLEGGFVRLRLHYDSRQLRPGNTIAGPVIFTLADAALYALVMSVAGLVPEAVTSDITLRFLRRPRPADLIAEARLLKQGRRLVVGEVAIFSDGDSVPVAHVTGTYALP